MYHSKWILVLVLVLASSSESLAQQPATNAGPSHKYRTILTISGAAGGFASGVYLGLAKFDDAPYSERKVTTTAIIGGVGGAVGGYFLGRVFDRRRDRARAQSVTRSLDIAPIVSTDEKGVRLAFSF